MKVCTKCNIEKDLDCFAKNKYSKDGLRNDCRDCYRETRRIYRQNNKEKLKEKQNHFIENNKDYFKEYAQNNKESLKEYRKKYDLENSDEIKTARKEYRIKNDDKIKKYQKEYRFKNKEKLKILKKEYYNKSGKYKKRDRKEYNKNYQKNRKEIDKLFKISSNIRTLISRSIKYKNEKSENIIGMKFEDFKLYLESKFKVWMSWENYGLYNGELNYGWDIDHIIPISTAKNEEEILLLNHTNLQPLCSKVNRDIKKNNF